MKLLLIIGLLFFSDSISVPEVRAIYTRAITDSEVAEKMLITLDESNCTTPLLLAYRASAQALIAKHALNPYRKLSMLKLSAETFDQAIQGDPENVEIHFLRFSVQHYLPSWLGFSDDLENDKAVIVQNLPMQIGLFKKDYAKAIIQFLIETERCTKNELSVLKKVSY